MQEYYNYFWHAHFVYNSSYIVIQDGARYDKSGNRIKRPASNKYPRQQVKQLLIPKQAVPKQSRPLIKVQKKNYQQYKPTKVVRNIFQIQVIHFNFYS